MNPITVSFLATAKDIEQMDRMIESGEYMNRSDLIRHAIRELIKNKQCAPQR